MSVFSKMYSNTPNLLLMETGDVQCTHFIGPDRHPAPDWGTVRRCTGRRFRNNLFNANGIIMKAQRNTRGPWRWWEVVLVVIGQASDNGKHANGELKVIKCGWFQFPWVRTNTTRRHRKMPWWWTAGSAHSMQVRKKVKGATSLYDEDDLHRRELWLHLQLRLQCHYSNIRQLKWRINKIIVPPTAPARAFQLLFELRNSCRKQICLLLAERFSRKKKMPMKTAGLLLFLDRSTSLWSSIGLSRRLH